LKVLGRQGRHGGRCDAQGFQHPPRLLWWVNGWVVEGSERRHHVCPVLPSALMKGMSQRLLMTCGSHTATDHDADGVGPHEDQCRAQLRQDVDEGWHATPQHTMAGRAC
jgi:hypothetical protein